MIAAAFLVIAIFVMWLLFFIVQFAAALSLVAIVIAVGVTVGAYGFSFLGFYYLFGQANIGWAIFAAMFLGTVLVGEIWKSMKRFFNLQKGA